MKKKSKLQNRRYSMFYFVDESRQLYMHKLFLEGYTRNL